MQISDAIWDMKVENNMVILGCDEGMVSIYKREDNELNLIKESRRQKSKCLMVDYSQETEGRKTIYGMFDDNIVRKMEWSAL